MRRSLKWSRVGTVVAVPMLAAGLVLATTPGDTTKTVEMEVDPAAFSDSLTALVGSLAGEVVTLDPATNPMANLVVRCGGSGQVTFDNLGSTTEQGFDLVIGTVITTYSVDAGKTLTFSFSGIPAGTEVAAKTGAGVPIVETSVPSECVVADSAP